MNAVWRYIVASWRGELSIIAAFLVYGGGGLIVLTAFGIFLAFRGDFDGSHPTIYSAFKLIYLVWFNLTGIVIARQTIGTCVELRQHDLAQMLLRFPRSTCVVVEVRDAMARLISLIVEIRCKEPVELADESGWSTAGLDDTLNVVGYEECVLPWNSLRDEWRGL